MKCLFLCKWNTWQSGCTKPTLERCPHGRAVDCLCGAGGGSNETQPSTTPYKPFTGAGTSITRTCNNCGNWKPKTDPKPETKAGDIIYGGGGGGGTMREILFRGKWEYDDHWFEGYLVKAVGGECMILPVTTEHWGGGEFSKCYHCDPATVGQYTGLTDKNGKKIFEGDIVYNGAGDPGVVKWLYGSYVIHFSNGEDWDMCQYVKEEYTEVIGNIHDNPDLMEQEG